jgi:hypothetical protein
MSWSADPSCRCAGFRDVAAPNRGACNILGDARRFFSSDLIRRIALYRCLSSDSVDRGVALALPFLLVALAKLASQPNGARTLAGFVARQYPATLETIRTGIGCERQDVAGAYGSGYMAHLVGEGAFTAVCTNVARFSPLSDQESRLLVGLVGWVLMSQLRAEQRRQDLHPSGLASLLERGAANGSEPVCSRSSAHSRLPA